MHTLVGEDYVAGMGYIGLSPGRLYRMGPMRPYETVEVSGDGAVTLENCREISSLRIFGKSVQTQTTGAQLFDKDNVQYAEVYYDEPKKKFTVARDGIERRMYFVKAVPNTRYTVSKTIGTYLRLVTCPDVPVDGGTGTNTITSNANVATVTTGKSDNYLAIYPVNFAEVGSVSYAEVEKTIMLNAGSIALSWEAYTGGAAAPNPEYPQEIKGVAIRTKNLFDGYVEQGGFNGSTGASTSTNTRIRSGYIPVKPNTTYFFRGMRTVYMYEYGEDKVGFQGASKSLNRDSGTVTTRENAAYIRFAFAKDDLVTPIAVTDMKPYMLTEGTETIPYEPYGCKTTVCAGGKNLLDDELLEQGALSGSDGSELEGSYVKIRVRTKGFLNLLPGEYTVSTNAGQVYVMMYDESKKMETNNPAGVWRDGQSTFTFQRGYVRFVFRKKNPDAEIRAEDISAQLEAGNAATEYEPYFPAQTSYIYTKDQLHGIPVASGENGKQWICDEINLKSGKYEKRFEKMVFDGNINLRYEKNESEPTVTDGKYTVNCIIKGVMRHRILCNYFRTAEPFWTNEITYVKEKGDWIAFARSNSNELVFVINYAAFPTKEDFKRWLQDRYDNGNPLILLHGAEQPIKEIDLTKEEMAAYRELVENSTGTVHLAADGGEVQPEIKVTYKKGV